MFHLRDTSIEPRSPSESANLSGLHTRSCGVLYIDRGPLPQPKLHRRLSPFRCTTPSLDVPHHRHSPRPNFQYLLYSPSLPHSTMQPNLPKTTHQSTLWRRLHNAISHSVTTTTCVTLGMVTTSPGIGLATVRSSRFGTPEISISPFLAILTSSPNEYCLQHFHHSS